MLEAISKKSAVTCRTRVRVRVRDMSLLADIGISPEEIGRCQPIAVTVELELRERSIGEIGEITDYWCTSATAEVLAAVHIPLIETFALELISRCFEMSNVVHAFVVIDNPCAIARGMAGAKIEMMSAEKEKRCPE